MALAFSGNLTRDPELRYGKSGTPWVTFTVAETRGRDDNKKTTFWECKAFGDMAEHVAEFSKGQRLIALASDRPLVTTQLLLTRPGTVEPEVLLHRQGDSWCLPGGEGWEENTIPGWDVGSRIGSLTSHVRDRIGLELPWVSYIGDFDEGPGLCRVYGFPGEENAALVTAASRHPACRWVAQSALSTEATTPDLVCEALRRWLDPEVVRGKGLSQVQGKVNQYAV